MAWRVIKAIIILPGTALIVIPGTLLWLTAGTRLAAAPAAPDGVRFWLAITIGAIGLAFLLWTVAIFMRVGRGTPAPWDPPAKLVVLGPYRHVRNPMISGVIVCLLGEALGLGAWPIGGWGLFFLAANAVYFPLNEEPALERRFGEDYRLYKANVPRWVPKLRPWHQPGA